jgi:cbb3-type cytochrome oxidase subunit 3
MFSFGQLIFGICFFIVFMAIVILSYKNDKKRQPHYFKGSYKVLVGFIIAFGLLVFIKYLTQQ